jgi:hypothetical protein
MRRVAPGAPGSVRPRPPGAARRSSAVIPKAKACDGVRAAGDGAPSAGHGVPSAAAVAPPPPPPPSGLPASVVTPPSEKPASVQVNSTGVVRAPPPSPLTLGLPAPAQVQPAAFGQGSKDAAAFGQSKNVACVAATIPGPTVAGQGHKSHEQICRISAATIQKFMIARRPVVCCERGVDRMNRDGQQLNPNDVHTLASFIRKVGCDPLELERCVCVQIVLTLETLMLSIWLDGLVGGWVCVEVCYTLRSGPLFVQPSRTHGSEIVGAAE